MNTQQDVIIVGGGVVGAACAREFARSGRAVTVLEPDDRQGQAWRASAGLLSPLVDSGPDDLLLELGVAGREYYRDRAAELEEETGISLGLFDEGILRLALDEEEMTRLRTSVAWLRQHGYRVDWLAPAEVKADWPFIGEMEGALWAPHDGALDPVRLVEALRASATLAGARFVTDEGVSLEGSEGSRPVVRGRSDRYQAEHVVLAAGAWTGRMAGLPRPISVEPVRGQMQARKWPAGLRPAVVFGRHCYVLERGGEALSGATVEHAGFTAETTAAGQSFVTERTRVLVPSLAAQPVLRSWAGLRPGTPDGLPIVGPEPRMPGLWYATGHGRNGILLAGITAVILGHLMAEEATFESVEALRPERFWNR
ncbi:MAG: FAD-dependent oxidoreductase [Gemmatimonadales bacterium]